MSEDPGGTPWPRLVVACFARGWLALCAGLLLWGALPMAFGWETTVVSSGSMEPRLPVGSLLLSAEVPEEEIRTGHVALVESGGADRLMSHRVVGRTDDGSLLLRGDANGVDDSSPVPLEDLHGIGRLLVPWAGLPLVWLRGGDWIPLAVLLAGTASALALTGGGPRLTGRQRVPVVAGVLLVAVVAPAATPSADAAFTARTTNPGSTFAAAAAFRDYAATVLADGPSLFWALDEAAGATTAANSAPVTGFTGAYAGGPVLSAASSAPGQPGSARQFDGGDDCVRGTTASAAPTVYSLEIWFRTTTATGGKLIGFGNSLTGLSSTYDRHIYMTNTGKLVFGAYRAVTFTVASPLSYNDGNWHHAVASQDSTGMKLYVDGTAVASSANTLAEVSNSGSWRIGCDNLASWPDRPVKDFFTGQLDNAAVYPTALSPARVAAHRAAAQ